MCVINEYPLELSLLTLKSTITPHGSEHYIHGIFPEQHAIALNEHLVIPVCIQQRGRCNGTLHKLMNACITDDNVIIIITIIIFVAILQSPRYKANHWACKQFGMNKCCISKTTTK